MPQADNDAHPPPDDPIILTLPAKGNPDRYELRQSTLDRWQSEHFPDMDCVAVCKRAMEWINAKIAKKQRSYIPMAKSMEHWLFHTWLCRDFDRKTYPRLAQPYQGGQSLSLSEKLMNELERCIGNDARDWFDDMRPTLDGTVMRIGIPSLFRVNHVRSEYEEQMLEAAQKVDPSVEEITVELCESSVQLGATG